MNAYLFLNSNNFWVETDINPLGALNVKTVKVKEVWNNKNAMKIAIDHQSDSFKIYHIEVTKGKSVTLGEAACQYSCVLESWCCQNCCAPLVAVSGAMLTLLL